MLTVTRDPATLVALAALLALAWLAWANTIKASDGYACTVPGCATPFDRARAHHIRPLAAGGSDELSNGETLCYGHHQEEHQR